jgi:hypothetical protein
MEYGASSTFSAAAQSGHVGRGKGRFHSMKHSPSRQADIRFIGTDIFLPSSAEQRSAAVFTRDHHWFLFWAGWIQSTLPYPDLAVPSLRESEGERKESGGGVRNTISSWLQIQRSRVRFPALPDFLRSSGSGTGSTQPREYNWRATWKEK